MKRALILLMLLATNTVAQETNTYELDVSIEPSLIFGECKLSKAGNNFTVDKDFIYELGMCTSNFFNPSIPSPFDIFSPISGDKLDKKIDYIWASGLLAPLTILQIIFYTVLEIISSSINFLIAFGGRFFFTYMFYVSIVYQTILAYIDQNRSLEHEDKVIATIFIIGLSTIISLGGGLV